MLKVLSRDNRGDERVQFGYVYFDDGSRVAYAPGIAKDLIGFPGLFIPNNSWGELRTEHLRLASEYLTRVGVDLNPEHSGKTLEEVSYHQLVEPTLERLMWESSSSSSSD